jgi:hypothetical protein
MAESYAQRRNAVVKTLRQLKRSLNLTNAQLEKMRRETDRLLLRKTLISTDSLVKLGNEYSSLISSINGTSRDLTAAMNVAGSYV